MRPIKLTLTAFGPFADTQTVDFRPALAARLFGIYGPTGAGKTSILDGICFSLFGESSGQERQGDDLRSHHASPDVETEARLIFEVGAKRYHVVRRPRQFMRGVRSTGLVERVHRAALYDATDIDVDDIDADNPGVVLAERKVELVADQMRSILNYNAAQFRQVVLLPQGQFRKLLTASSDDRSAVLRGLFDVALYERFVERLKAEASDLKDKVESGRSAITGHLQAHDVSDAEGLAQLVEVLTADEGLQTVGRDTARAARDAARAALLTNQQVEDRLLEHDAAAVELDGIVSRTGEVDLLKARKTAAERALGCAAADSRAAEAEGDLMVGLQVQAEAEEEASGKKRVSAAAIAALQASAARQPEREAAVARVTQLEGFQARVARAEPLRAAAQQSASVVALAKQGLDEAAAAYNAAELAAAAATTERDLAQERALDISQLEGSVQNLKQAQDRALSFASATAAVERLEAIRADAQAKLALLNRTLGQAREAEDAAEQAMASAQAGHLAHKLQDGQPCPVCGSLDHPQPASQTEEGQGLDARWREARAEREAADAEERNGVKLAARADGEWAQAVDQLAELQAPANDLSSITSELAAAEGDLTSLREQPDLATTQAALDAAKAIVVSTLADLTTARDRHTKADKATGSDASALEAALADVPAELREAEAVVLELRAAVESRDQLNAAHQSALDAERQASGAFELARSRLSHAQDRVKELGAARDTRLAAFNTAKSAAGLTDESYAQAKADVPNLESLSTQIAEHVAALAAAEGRRDRAALAISGLERPNMEAASGALAEADAALAEAEGALTTTSVKLGQATATQALIAKLAGDLAETTERYRVLGELAQLTDGKNAHRLRLRDFAIAATFDLVLEAANQRFERMSRGRFSLLRKYEGGDGRARTGLDVEVYDAHTDQKRDAHTLSGGEGFLASLSLALGLSDVVQAESGGVRLDAIFIDEGFGHLDDETLDVALDTLRDLVGQDRAVGVISHVETVKEQIPMGFDIIRQPEGSVVRERLGE